MPSFLSFGSPLGKSVSKTYLSNDVFYGDTNIATSDQFVTQTKLMQSQEANAYRGMADSPVRYGKGQKPAGPTLQGILGEEKCPPTPTRLSADTFEELRAAELRSQIKEISDSNREMNSMQMRS